MPRKELHAECTGGIFCPVAGHVETVTRGVGRHLHRHVPLTPGQKRTLYERRTAARAREAALAHSSGDSSPSGPASQLERGINAPSRDHTNGSGA